MNVAGRNLRQVQKKETFQTINSLRATLPHKMNEQITFYKTSVTVLSTLVVFPMKYATNYIVQKLDD